MPCRGKVAQEMSAIKEAQAHFEHAWAQMYKAYRPLLTADDNKALVHRVSAMKGLAWNLYLQGRTDEMARQIVASKASALARSRFNTVSHSVEVEPKQVGG